MAVELRDVTDGVWVWRVQHPSRPADAGWPPLVSSTCVESSFEVVLIDPLAPRSRTTRAVGRASTRGRRLVVAILKPDHVRACVDRFVRALRRPGPSARGCSSATTSRRPSSSRSSPATASRPPGGLVPLYDGRSREETPMWVPERRTLVFADALTGPDGELRVWATPWHEQAVLPALRAMLELPFAHVVVAHGAPVHDRAAFERALALPPWSGLIRERLVLVEHPDPERRGEQRRHGRRRRPRASRRRGGARRRRARRACSRAARSGRCARR